MMNKPIFDAHLDLAMNALLGRDITLPASEQPPRPDEIATVGLPDLRSGGVTRICATLFCQPTTETHTGYTTPQQAFEQATAQLDYYDQLHNRGELAIVGQPPAAKPSAIDATILLEGADAIRTPEDVDDFYSRNVRIVGLAWRQTRYAGGTGAPGPLTDAGKQIVRKLDDLGIIHDASHLSEQSFWDLIRCSDRLVIATHSNCRGIVGRDPYGRHLTDDMIRAIVQRNGVIGINAFDRFLLPHDQYGARRAGLNDMVAHMRYVCDLAGDTLHVGIGTDMDGGLGRDQIPQEMTTIADLPKLAEALANAGFSPSDIDQILFGNWNRVLGGK